MLSPDQPYAIERVILFIVQRDNPGTTEELAHSAGQQLHIPKADVLRHILSLQSNGCLQLTGIASSPASLRMYLSTDSALWYWLTVALAVTTATAIFLTPANAVPWVYVRHLLGTIFILWVPGYSFIKALFPSNSSADSAEKRLLTIERLALGLSMSLALVPMAGLVLNYTPWGVHPTSIVFILLTAALIFATVGIVREYYAQRARAKAEARTP